MQTVLVVEDERDIRELLRRYLERAGLSVLTASTGAEALRLIEAIRPDLLLLDLGLPDIDGMEVLDSAAPGIPVIVLTARTGVDDRIAGLRMGADDYVVKPFSPTEVVLRVQAVLARRRSAARPGSAASPRPAHGRRGPPRGPPRRGALSLTPHEWDLLVALAGAPGRVFTRRELVERIGGRLRRGVRPSGRLAREEPAAQARPRRAGRRRDGRRVRLPARAPADD